MTLSEAKEQGYRCYPSEWYRVGTTVRFMKDKPFGVDMNPIGWDRWGPRFAPPYYTEEVTLQNQAEVDVARWGVGWGK